MAEVHELAGVSPPSTAADPKPAEPTSLERVLTLVDDQVPAEDAQPRQDQLGPALFNLQAGFIKAVQGQLVTVVVLSTGEELSATVAVHVDPRLVVDALTNQTLALLQSSPTLTQVIGFLQTRVPETTLIRANTIEIQADQQLTLRSGRAAIQLRSDGAIEMLGTRIAATSRGVFRLIGRALRLN